MDDIDRLGSEITKHPHIKVEDCPVVERVCAGLRIGDDPGCINLYIRTQVEIEAGITYLIGRYTSILGRLSFSYNEYKAGRFYELGDRNEEGLKWYIKDKESYLLGSDASFIAQTETVGKLENLISMLKGLSFIVFGRDRKLEQLSINYRHEMRTDKGSS